MFEVVLKVNGKVVAHASAFNLSDLTDRSDYEVEGHDLGSAKLGTSNFQFTGRIRDHWRRQSPWALAEKIAQLATEHITTGAER